MSKIKITGDVEWQEFETECVLLNLSTGYYYRLNQVGSFLWKLIDMGTDEKQLLKRLMDEFEVEEETALKDIRSFIRKMQKENLLTIE